MGQNLCLEGILHYYVPFNEIRSIDPGLKQGESSELCRLSFCAIVNTLYVWIRYRYASQRQQGVITTTKRSLSVMEDFHLSIPFVSGFCANQTMRFLL